MPRADDAARMEYDPSESPSIQLEAMGRGPLARKSKSLMPSIELASVLGMVKMHKEGLTDLLKTLHARSHQVQEVDEDGDPVWVMVPKLDDEGNLINMVPKLDEDGNLVPSLVPEVLSDAEVLKRYDGAELWQDFHQEQVEHYPSVGGFSTKAALGYEDQPTKSKEKQSSQHQDRSKRWG